MISIHALREEGDSGPSSKGRRAGHFYPRPPRGGRLHLRPSGPLLCLFLSTPSARRATPRDTQEGAAVQISIHALREEGDCCPSNALLKTVLFLSTPSARRATDNDVDKFIASYDFYPRPPRGGRPSSTMRSRGALIFLSTPSARRATCLSRRRLQGPWNFYPRPPRGGRPCIGRRDQVANQFLSTPSARRATAKTETKSLFSYKLYNILHEFRRALIYNGSKSYPNHAK